MKAEGWRDEFRRKQRLIDSQKESPDISHGRLEHLAMYCQRVPLGHYEGHGGLFEFVPILVNVVSAACARIEPRRRNSADRCPCARSSARRSPPRLPRAGASCRSTCTASPASARTRSLPRAASPPSSWPSRRRARVFSRSVRAPSPLRRRAVSPARPRADTGRIVGTGCDSPQAARLAVARAQRQVCHESGVLLRLRNFAVRPHAPFCRDAL